VLKCLVFPQSVLFRWLLMRRTSLIMNYIAIVLVAVSTSIPMNFKNEKSDSQKRWCRTSGEISCQHVPQLS